MLTKRYKINDSFSRCYRCSSISEASIEYDDEVYIYLCNECADNLERSLKAAFDAFFDKAEVIATPSTKEEVEQAKKERKTLYNANNSHQRCRFTPAEVEIVRDVTLTSREVAEKLGRTKASVDAYRWRMKIKTESKEEN